MIEAAGFVDVQFSERRWDAFGGSASESSANKYGTEGVTIMARKPDVSAAERLLAALAGRDFTALEASLDPAVRFRALTPSRLYEAAGAAEAAGYSRRWFGDADSFEVLASEVGEVAGRQRLSYRFRLHDEDGWQVIEQLAYVDERAGLVTKLDVLCSGFRPEGIPTDSAEPAPTSERAPLPQSDAVLDAPGEGCATLTPLIRNHIRGLQSGQILEVRSDDPAARDGVPAWSRLTGHELLAVDSDATGGSLRFFLRRK